MHTTAEGICLIEELIGRKAELVATAPRSGDQVDTRAVTEKAKQLLNFVPKTSLEEGLLLQLAWHEKKLIPYLEMKNNKE